MTNLTIIKVMYIHAYYYTLHLCSTSILPINSNIHTICDYIISYLLCTHVAHKPAEVVDVSVYQMPSVEEGRGEGEAEECVYQPRLLLEDKMLYTDMSSYLAELLVQSVSDNTQVCTYMCYTCTT